MSRHFEQDATRSIRAFAQFVSPVLQTAFCTDAVFSTERRHNDFEETLDRECCIDALVVTDDGTIYPIASRVQFGGKNFAAFSIFASQWSNDRDSQTPEGGRNKRHYAFLPCARIYRRRLRNRCYRRNRRPATLHLQSPRPMA